MQTAKKSIRATPPGIFRVIARQPAAGVHCFFSHLAR
ncbi:hypothetical protein W822_01370 [Advenella kashmirensis W13003]|uniref:Uncharacterized protein n=1 Tax=Advenella kashmirensis W13003 TaxID=1424334 RepID=V8R055_9BURK|nr:hypothetical protein W822_01370 [Advenella kashmirensis W13003]